MSLQKELLSHQNKIKAKFLSGFFKTGKGQYGEGDIFLGINVPTQRLIAKKYKDLDLKSLLKILRSKYHEFRLTSLLILVEKYKTSLGREKKEIVNLYLSCAKNINNWDLVDLSAPNILGDYFKDKDRSVLYALAKSNNLWEKRISIISTLAFIKTGDFADTLKISKALLGDTNDLIHKAVGWMLREVGKKNESTLLNFLDKNYKTMPRTSLRYAIERLDQNKKFTT
ncbi:DNA alkylation repair protein [Candidatus Curtissbacteria bacterium]|nr:DNA alkylation repair protein [Candidatus Curtissbacteria bacterium]